MSTGQGNGGDFVLPDDSGTQTDLNTLFGVNAAVGQAPVLLRRGTQRVTAVGTLHETQDESTTLAGALQSFYGLTPDALMDLQKRLYEGGFYSDSYYSAKGKQPQFGTPDDDTYAAYKKAVTQAARSGQPLPELIDNAGQARAAMGTTTTPVQFTHPDDLRAAFDSLGPQVIGRRPDAGVVDNAIAAYHELEASGANKADQAGNVTGPPSVSAYVEQYLRRTYPADAFRNGYADAYDSLTNLIRSTAQ